MPEDTRTPRHERLLIKLIMPKQGAERRVQGGGTPARPFRTVDTKYRTRLSNQVSAIRNAVVPQMKRTGAAPVRVKLLSKAAAKSHRPEHLFSPESCPIVGSGRLGELFVKATPRRPRPACWIHREQQVRPHDQRAFLRRDPLSLSRPLIAVAASTPWTCFAAVRGESTGSSRACGYSTSARNDDQRRLVEDFKAPAKSGISRQPRRIFAIELRL